MSCCRGLVTLVCAVFMGFVVTAPVQGAATSAVAVLLDEEAPRDHGDRLLDAVTGAFLDSQRFSVIERSRIAEVLRERQFRDFVGEDAQELGNLVGADYVALVTYSIREGDDVNAYTIRCRVVSVSSGQVRATIDSKPSLLDRFGSPSIEDAGRRLLESIKAEFPVEGYVVRIDGKEVIVDLGKADGLEKGDMLEIIRIGDPIPHPVEPGVMIPGEERVVGKLKIETVTETTALCKLKRGGMTPEVGDRARFRKNRFF